MLDTRHPLPNPRDEQRAQRLAVALAPTNPRAAQLYLGAAARVAGWTPILRRANTIRGRLQRYHGEQAWRRQNGGQA